MRGPWFDEAFDQDGSLRRPYRALRQRACGDPLRPTAAVAEELRDRPFDDGTRILPVPLVIDETEYRSVIQAGVAQRALALQQLFADLVLGEQQVLTAGIGLHRGLLDEILTAAGTSLRRLQGLWRAHGREGIRFVYGPDLVRDPGGRWMVLEDNLGCVGGSADSFFVADRYRCAAGMPGCPTCQRPPDLAIAIRRWLSRLGHDPHEGVAAVFGCETAAGTPWAPRLHENARRRLILDGMGIPVIDRTRLDRRQSADGAPTALVNFDVDESWSQTFGRPGLAMFNAPGAGILGSKALLPFADDIVRFYLREEPILPTPPTRLLSSGLLPPDPENWVVKTTAGCQGTEVVVLGWQPREQLGVIEDLVRGQWRGAAAVAQRYVEPSRLAPGGPGSWDGYQIEIRPVAYVLGWRELHVSEQPAGKAVSIYDARRLNNISQGACYVPVLRQPCPGCVTAGQ